MTGLGLSAEDASTAEIEQVLLRRQKFIDSLSESQAEALRAMVSERFAWAAKLIFGGQPVRLRQSVQRLGTALNYAEPLAESIRKRDLGDNAHGKIIPGWVQRDTTRAAEDANHQRDRFVRGLREQERGKVVSALAGTGDGWVLDELFNHPRCKTDSDAERRVEALEIARKALKAPSGLQIPGSMREQCTTARVSSVNKRRGGRAA
jgi:hypothetical protein